MGKTVLVVDDEVELREILEFYLETENYNVLLAASGSEALDVVDNNDVDLVISDMQMPGGDGLSLLKSLREKKDTPFILLTGFDAGKLADAQDLGLNEALEKPIGKERLLQAVASCLGRS